MIAENGGAGGHHPPAAAHTAGALTRCNGPSQGSRTRPERAVGSYYAPAGRRTLGLVLVRRCPRCSGAHVHRVPSAVAADGAVRTAGCGVEYKIRISGAFGVQGGAVA